MSAEWNTYCQNYTKPLKQGLDDMACFMKQGQTLVFCGTSVDGFKPEVQSVQEVTCKCDAGDKSFAANGIKVNGKKYVYVREFDDEVGGRDVHTVLFRKGKDHFAIAIGHTYVMAGDSAEGIEGWELMNLLRQGLERLNG